MIDITKLMDEAKTNLKKLESCKLHKFDIDLMPDKPEILKVYKCSKCGGELNWAQKIWYERGVEHAKNRAGSWIVHDYEEGLVMITDDHEEAEREYELYKEETTDYVRNKGEFSGDERVILARIEKDFHSFDTGEPVEGESKETYWDTKEDIYE